MIFDTAISLGQYCITSVALRRLNLQQETMVFDWSGGFLTEKCGLGGLEGKVNLICNDFKDFFNLEDLENKGNNPNNDMYNLWIVNKRTGLQYKHDFNSNRSVEEQYPEVKARYTRRAERLYSTIAKCNRILFVFMARDTGFSNELLIEQQKKLAKKFFDKQIYFLYVLHDDKFSPDEYEEIDLTHNIHCIYCNFNHPTSNEFPESWNGNTRLYYPLVAKFCGVSVNLDSIKELQEAK